MSVTSASRLSILLGFLALGCAEHPLSAEETMSSEGPAIHFVTGAGEVTRAFLPEQVDVKLTGLPPASRVTVRASMPGFASHATFVADAAGAVDVAVEAPEEGTYEGADADGLFWSMVSTGAASADEPEQIDVDVRAEIDGKVVATATLARADTTPGVVETPVHDDGLVAVLVTPAAPGPHPALLTFGGSEGGIDWGRKTARLYASLGYTCLGLAYFGAPGLPPNLEDLPLEYFGKAIAWLKQRPEVKADAIGVMGVSRGGELALLLGAHFPDVKAVVAQVPSGVVWPGWDPDQVGSNTGSWTLGGKELSYVPPSDTPPKLTSDGEGHQIEHDTPMFTGALAAASNAELDAATTRVEHVKGPVLLLASADDQIWPSCRLAGIAMDRLQKTGHADAFADDFVCYPDAGHITGTPGLPTTGLPLLESHAHSFIAIGGTPAGIARAARDEFEKKRAFLAAALR